MQIVACVIMSVDFLTISSIFHCWMNC